MPACLPLRLLTAVVLGATIVASACQRTPDPLVVLFCLDGATLEVIDDLRSQRRLPAFERLIRSGTYGRMESLAARRILKDYPRRGYSSPIVWTTIATGKLPEKHGVRDFVLPLKGTSSVWVGSKENPARAELTIPELRGQKAFTLHLRLRSHRLIEKQSVQLLLNEEPLETIQVPTKWKEFSLRLPAAALRPVKNKLVLIPSQQIIPAEHEESSERRVLAFNFASLSIVDARGEVLFSLDPVDQRFSLGEGFYPPRGNLTEVQSVHWRAMPMWSLLGDLGRPVGIIGFWGTWPAYPVNGFLVTSRMGIGVKRRGSKRLTWPPELADELEPLAPGAGDLEAMLAKLHLSDCEPPLLEKRTGVKKILLQDEFYFRIARELFPSMDRGFYSVYFRSIDLVSHVSLHWRHGAELRKGCSESVREIVDETYVQIDRWIGDLLEILPQHATVVVVSDHGEQPIRGGGHHARYGIFLAKGEGIRKEAAFHGSSALEVAPTILSMFGAPIPLDMDGKLLAPIFESSWLAKNPPHYVDIDTSLSSNEEALTEGREEILEELRSLGYIQ